MCSFTGNIFSWNLAALFHKKTDMANSEWQLPFWKTKNVQHQKQSYLHSIYMAELENLTKHLDCAWTISWTCYQRLKLQPLHMYCTNTIHKVPLSDSSIQQVNCWLVNLWAAQKSLNHIPMSKCRFHEIL